jgi:O-antigen ligase
LSTTIGWGVVAALVFTCLAHGAVEPWSILIFEVLIIVLMLLWGAKALYDKQLRLVIPDAALPLAALLVLGLVQSIVFTGESGRWVSLSADVGATRSTVIVIVFLLISFLLASNVLGTRRRLGRFANFAVIFGLALAIFGLVQSFTWNGKLYWIRPTDAPSPFGPFANHSHFAGYMEMLIPIPIALAVKRAVRGELRVLYVFAAAMMMLSVVASLSRGGMISVAGGVTFIVLVSAGMLWTRRTRRSSRAVDGALSAGRTGSSPAAVIASQVVLAMALVGVITAGIFWIGADPVIERVTKGQPVAPGAASETFYMSRGWVWRDAAAMIIANPIFGVGLGAFGTAFPIYTRSDGSIRVPQAHNDYLQILADGGIVGGIIAAWFIVLVFRAVRRGVRSTDPLLSGLALGSGASIFSILVHSIFDINLQVPSNALLFLVFAAIASSIAAISETGSPNTLAPRGRASETRTESVPATVQQGVLL